MVVLRVVISPLFEAVVGSVEPVPGISTRYARIAWVPILCSGSTGIAWGVSIEAYPVLAEK